MINVNVTDTHIEVTLAIVEPDDTFNPDENDNHKLYHAEIPLKMIDMVAPDKVDEYITKEFNEAVPQFAVSFIQHQLHDLDHRSMEQENLDDTFGAAADEEETDDDDQ